MGISSGHPFENKVRPHNSYYSFLKHLAGFAPAAFIVCIPTVTHAITSAARAEAAKNHH